jgi:IclR family transcriptional regulator, pca regulon regulatory protein
VHEGRMPLVSMVERCLPALVKIQAELSALL